MADICYFEDKKKKKKKKMTFEKNAFKGQKKKK